MHESSLGQRIVQAALAAVAAEAGGAAALEGCVVSHIQVTLVESEALQPDSLAFHVAAHAQGTAAAGARLHLDLTQARACCAHCGTWYPYDHHLPMCTHCSSVETRDVEPTFVRIDRVAWQERRPTASPLRS